jgi:2',3'-cyclic-nucleotide 2'-phosphodiesterase (5'-nucleotidase family)
MPRPSFLRSPPSASRRKFLAGAGNAAAAEFLPFSLRANGDDEDLQTISILHTAGLHGPILPTEIYEGALMVKLPHELRYDAWVLGNHDFD